MAEIKLRYNDSTEEVELVVDGDVTLASGPEVFESWVRAYNNKRIIEEPKPVPEVPQPEESNEVNAEDEGNSTDGAGPSTDESTPS